MMNQTDNSSIRVGMILNKHAKALLDTSAVDETILLQKLQNDRLDKIEDIERSLRVDDNQRYIQETNNLSRLGYLEDPYGFKSMSKSKFLGERSDFVDNSKRMNNSVDSRRQSDSTLVNLRFAPKKVTAGRHKNDPFIANLV